MRASSGLFFGQALCWSAIAIALAIVLPGGSYLAIVPAMACAICALLRLHEGPPRSSAPSITAILVFPFGLALYDALGRPILPVIAVLIALAATTFAPFLAAVAALRRPLVASHCRGDRRLHRHGAYRAGVRTELAAAHQHRIRR